MQTMVMAVSPRRNLFLLMTGIIVLMVCVVGFAAQRSGDQQAVAALDAQYQYAVKKP